MKQLTLNYYGTFKLLEPLAIAGIVYAMKSYVSYETVIKTIYGSSIIQAIIGFWQFHVQQSLGLRWLGEYVAPLGTPGLATIDTTSGKLLRAYGTFPHPNILGIYLVFGYIIGLHLVSRETRGLYPRIITSILNIVLLIGIYLTFSRIAWAAAGMCTVAYLIHYFRKSASKWILGVVIVSCATILSFWSNLIFTRILGITNSSAYIDRGILNHMGIEIARTHLWLGTGWGNYIQKMEAMFHMQPWEYQPPHNIYIYLAATLGLPIAILFVYIVARLIWNLWKSKPAEIRFLLLVWGLTLIFMSNFDHFLVTIQQGQLLLAYSLGLIAAYTKSQTQTTEI